MSTWVLTKRGRLARDYLVLVLAIVLGAAALVWCYTTGQDRQCHWYEIHGTYQQVKEHCQPGR